MSTQNKASLPVIRRLPKYYRYISDMKKNGVTKISSSELARMMGTTASQVRQDFNCFGGFGQQGIGYQIDVLWEEINHLLFHDGKLNTILVGTGRLGRAIFGYLTAEARGYHLMAAFDCNPDEIGKKEDVAAIKACANSGVRVITSVHGSDVNDLKNSEIYETIERKDFQIIVFLTDKPTVGTVREVLRG